MAGRGSRLEQARRTIAASDALLAALNTGAGVAAAGDARLLAEAACAASELASRLSGTRAVRPSPADLALDASGCSGLWRGTVAPAVRDVLEAASEVTGAVQHDSPVADAQFVVESFAEELDRMRQAPGFTPADVPVLASAVASTYAPSLEI